ncbi:MAG: hypothetical protein AAFN74_10790 [Myxococcota bacterium]
MVSAADRRAIREIEEVPLSGQQVQQLSARSLDAHAPPALPAPQAQKVGPTSALAADVDEDTETARIPLRRADTAAAVMTDGSTSLTLARSIQPDAVPFLSAAEPGVSRTPQEALLMAKIDGELSVRELQKATGLSPVEIVVGLIGLLDQGAIRMTESSAEPRIKAVDRLRSTRRNRVGQTTRRRRMKVGPARGTHRSPSSSDRSVTHSVVANESPTDLQWFDEDAPFPALEVERLHPLVSDLEELPYVSDVVPLLTEPLDLSTTWDASGLIIAERPVTGLAPIPNKFRLKSPLPRRPFHPAEDLEDEFRGDGVTQPQPKMVLNEVQVRETQGGRVDFQVPAPARADFSDIEITKDEPLALDPQFLREIGPDLPLVLPSTRAEARSDSLIRPPARSIRGGQTKSVVGRDAPDPVPVATPQTQPLSPMLEHIEAVESRPRRINRKAERLFEEALKDRATGNLVSARLNMKLALAFEPDNVEYQEAFKALEDDPAARARTPSDVVRSARDYFEEAKEAEHRGQIDDCVQLLEKAVVHSRQAVYLNRLGVMLATKKGAYARAQALLEEATKLKPGNATYARNLQKIRYLASSEEGRGAAPRELKTGILQGLFGRLTKN